MARFIVLMGMMMMLTLGAVLAQDDEEGDNNPVDDDRANACYAGGTLEGKCTSDYEWEAGWYLIRYEFGLINADNFPEQYDWILPPANSGPGCISLGTDAYANFESDILSPGSNIYTDAACQNASFTNGFALVYTLIDADAARQLCLTLGGSYATAMTDNPNVFMCVPN